MRRRLAALSLIAAFGLLSGAPLAQTPPRGAPPAGQPSPQPPATSPANTDPDTGVKTRVMRFAGQEPPYRVQVEFPWWEIEGFVAITAVNNAVARSVMEPVQQFSFAHARTESDPAWRERRHLARLEVTYRLSTPTPRLTCVVYRRVVNDGRSEDREAIFTDLFDLPAGRVLGVRDLFDPNTRWQAALGERLLGELRRQATQRGAKLFDGVRAADLAGESDRWAFERGGSTVHFNRGDVAPEAAGRFEVRLAYAELAEFVRKGGPLAALAGIAPRPADGAKAPPPKAAPK